jgi:hypothetical protein
MSGFLTGLAARGAGLPMTRVEASLPSLFEAVPESGGAELPPVQTPPVSSMPEPHAVQPSQSSAIAGPDAIPAAVPPAAGRAEASTPTELVQSPASGLQPVAHPPVVAPVVPLQVSAPVVPLPASAPTGHDPSGGESSRWAGRTPDIQPNKPSKETVTPGVSLVEIPAPPSVVVTRPSPTPGVSTGPRTVPGLATSTRRQSASEMMATGQMPVISPAPVHLAAAPTAINPPAVQPEGTGPIVVRIGRVEVRASAPSLAPAPGPPPAVAPATVSQGFAGYARLRTYRT